MNQINLISCQIVLCYAHQDEHFIYRWCRYSFWVRKRNKRFRQKKVSLAETAGHSNRLEGELSSEEEFEFDFPSSST